MSLPPPPPPPPPGQAAYGVVGATPAWRSLQGLSIALTVAMVLSAVGGTLAAFAFADRYDTFRRESVGGGAPSFQTLQDLDERVNLAVALVAVLGVTTTVLLVVWSWRAAKNLEVLGRPRPTLGPGWAIGAWLVPLGNLVLPLIVMKDIWKSGQPDVAWGDPTWRRRSRTGASLVAWWLAWVVAFVVWVSGTTDEELVTIEEVRANATSRSLGMALGVLASVLGVYAIRAMTRRQHTAFEAQQALVGQPGGPPGASGGYPPPAPAP